MVTEIHKALTEECEDVLEEDSSLRVSENHPLIGEYVVEVTDPISQIKALEMSIKLNAMVFRRCGVIDRFTIIHDGDGDEEWIVVRKLLEDDCEEFINEHLIDV